MRETRDVWTGPEWDALRTAMHKMPGCNHGTIGIFLLPRYHCGKSMIKINLFHRIKHTLIIQLKFWVPVCTVCKYIGKPKNPRFSIIKI